MLRENHQTQPGKIKERKLAEGRIMNPMSYNAIAPLIVELNTQGRSVNIIFQCPVSGEKVSARQHVAQKRTMGSQLQQSVQRNAMYAVQNMISQVIRSVFGYNMLGRVASDVTRQTVYSASNTMRNSLSKSEREQAVVDAFQSIQRKFSWDKVNNRWLSAKAAKETLSPFEQQQQQFPVQHPYDLQILSRMLVEIANADGRISREEGEWLMSMLDPSHGSIDSLLQRPRLTPAELQQTTKGAVRETMLMLVWALALSDEEFAAQEKDLLQTFASSFALSYTQVLSVQKKSQMYILDNAMETMFGWGGHDNFARQNILGLAKRIGLSETEALQAEAQFQRRKAQ